MKLSSPRKRGPSKHGPSESIPNYPNNDLEYRVPAFAGTTVNANVRVPLMNVNIQPPRIGPQPWEVVRSKLDQALPFANMRETPYYRDAIYEQFSKQEYERRYAALRSKMREHKLDAIIVPGGPSHWSFGGGMLWLTGHWEWHALCCYVLVPLDGEPTMIYSMGGTHAEA